MLDVSHNPLLVLASIAVALMAGFTGLSLTKGASALPVPRRKLLAAASAISLGGGIWSMHFVAMLGLQLPYPFYYDALITLISALIAILMVGLALLILHFLPRSRRSLLVSGGIVGLGIVLMHFVGMLGMQVCRPINELSDYFWSTLAAIALSSIAIWVAYDRRSNRNILLGTACFSAAVVSVHYLAMWQTGFAVTGGAAAAAGPALSNETLAMGVTVAAFLICGAFLLTGVTFFEVAQPAGARAASAADPPGAPSDAVRAVAEVEAAHPVPRAGVPYEKDGRTQFAQSDRIAAIRAEGHYTLLYIGHDKLFCPWSITEAGTRLADAGFVRTHRSYLVNPAHVAGFTRHKDSGTLVMAEQGDGLKVPISRSRLAPVRACLGV